MLLLWHRSVCLNIQNIKIHSCNCRQKYSPLCLGFGNEHISRWGLVSKDEWRLLIYFQPDGVILQWKQFCLKYYIVGCIMQLECRTFWSKVERIKDNHIRRLAGFRRSLPPKISNNPIYTLCLRKKHAITWTISVRLEQLLTHSAVQTMPHQKMVSLPTTSI